MKKLSRIAATLAFVLGGPAGLGVGRSTNLMQPTRPHRPDLDAMRKAEEKRQRKAAARRR